jgi:hypothetical protein
VLWALAILWLVVVNGDIIMNENTNIVATITIAVNRHALMSCIHSIFTPRPTSSITILLNDIIHFINI